MTVEQRRESISALYEEVLGRKADVPGLEHYVGTGMSLEQIRVSMESSAEYLDKHRKENFMSTVERIGSEDKLLMGACPTTEKHISSLQRDGVQAILNLEDTPFVEYDFSWCEDYLHLPISEYDSLSDEQLSQSIKFLYGCIHGKRLKTLVHCRAGLTVAPLFVAMYLVSSIEMSFQEALRLVLYKQPNVKPDRGLVSSSTLRYLYELRNELSEMSFSDTEVGLTSVAPNIFAGTSVTASDCFSLKKAKVGVILNLGPPNYYMPKESSEFEMASVPCRMSMAADDKDTLFSHVSEAVSVIQSCVDNSRKVYVYCPEESIISLICMAYLNYSGGVDLDKASLMTGKHFPTLISVPLVKEWLSQRQ